MMERLTYKDSTLPRTNELGDKIEAYSDYDVREIINRLADFEATGLTPEECAGFARFKADFDEPGNGLGISRIIEILCADAEGRLIVLPCKEGDTVWVVAYCDAIYLHTDWDTGAKECPFEDDCDVEECDNDTPRIFEATCAGFILDDLGKKLHILVKEIGFYDGDVLGKRVFLTREEAEAALGRDDT